MENPRNREEAPNGGTKAEPKSKSLSQLLVKRASIVAFIVALTSFALYIAGNYQSFLVETQLFLLDALRYSSYALMGLSAAGLALSAARMVRHRLRRGGPGFLAYALLLAFSLLSSAAASLVLIAATSGR